MDTPLLDGLEPEPVYYLTQWGLINSDGEVVWARSHIPFCDNSMAAEYFAEKKERHNIGKVKPLDNRNWRRY